MPSVLPTLEEARELVPRPGGHVWRLAGDVRGFNTAGYAVLLQVAHPTVGAGVGEYSGFLDDPWGRLYRTLDYVHGSIYGGPELAWEIGRRVRGIHKHIKGTRPDGERYHALEPRAYAWVHATLAAGFVWGAERFGTPLRPGEHQDFWEEWLRLGRLIGVRERDLPARWDDFRDYFDTTVEEELEDNPTVHLVLDSLLRPAPVLPGIPQPVWRTVRRPLAGQLRLTTVGMLGPRVREKLNLAWSPADERAFRALAAASRASTPLVRGPLAEFGPMYVRWRSRQLERGDVAARVPEKRTTAGAGTGATEARTHGDAERRSGGTPVVAA
jgi:uncharacterized protein (DUF2236 family)